MKSEGAATSFQAEQPSDGQTAWRLLNTHDSYLNTEYMSFAGNHLPAGASKNVSE